MITETENKNPGNRKKKGTPKPPDGGEFESVSIKAFNPMQKSFCGNQLPKAAKKIEKEKCFNGNVIILIQ